MTACKHCEAGIELRGKDHWIVKSIIPRIKIVRCEKLKESKRVAKTGTSR